MNTIDLEVRGMTCGACVNHVTQALQPLAGVSAVTVDIASGHVKVSGDLQQGGDLLISALATAGYPAKVSTESASASASASTPSPMKSGNRCCCG